MNNQPHQGALLAAALKLQFNMNGRALIANLDGITDDDALIQPPGGGNCINWTVGHILSSRKQIMESMGRTLEWDAAHVARYARGSAAIDSADAAPQSLSQLREVFATSQKQLMQALEEVTEEQWKEARGASTCGEQVAFGQFHEAYHVGQVALLRRLVGRAGAIR